MKHFIANGFSAAQDAEFSDADIDASSEAAHLEDQSSSSEEDEFEASEQSYDALLQMLSGPPTVPHARKKRKMLHRGRDETHETSKEFSKLPDKNFKAGSNLTADFNVDSNGQDAEVDFVEDDAQEFKVGDDEIDEMEGEEEDGTLP